MPCRSLWQAGQIIKHPDHDYPRVLEDLKRDGYQQSSSGLLTAPKRKSVQFHVGSCNSVMRDQNDATEYLTSSFDTNKEDFDWPALGYPSSLVARWWSSQDSREQS